ncbi:MAG TPA: hypothetical protein DCQ14_03900 [Firmicutes bacterium]|nr:hypothetical protein [Bacillota bacterium]
MKSNKAATELLNYCLSKKDENRACPLVLLSRVASAISGLSNLEAILSIGLNTTLELVDGTAGGIMLLDEDSGLLSYRLYRGLSDEQVEQLYLRLGEGIAGKVAESGKVIIVDDISSDADAIKTHFVSAQGLRTFVSIPLQAKERVLGVMNCASQTLRRFTEADAHLLHSIGDQLGIAIEHTRLGERLKKSREKYRLLARQIILAQEEERKRIARELHDETSQTLAGLALNLQALIEMVDMLGIKNEQFKTMLKKTHASTVRVNIEVSRLIADLRPVLLDILGLVPAIRQYAETSLTPLGIRPHFEFALEETKTILQQEEEVALFRWLQSAIGNVVQHAQAKHVIISLQFEDGNLVLRVSDDGRGFDVSKIPETGERGRGYGLFNMHERMKLIGAICSVHSEPRKGTMVRATIPVGERWKSRKAGARYAED